MATPSKDSPRGAVSLQFLQEAEGFEGEVRGANVLASRELCTGLPSFQYKELGPCQVYLLVDEWSSLSGDRSGSGAPGIGVAWGQNFPVPFSLGPTLTPGM